MINVTWYAAAHYCNWLSRQEKLAECYEPNQGACTTRGCGSRPMP